MMRAALIATIVALSGVALATPPNPDDMTGRRELQMMQCPAASPGVTTTLRKVARGIELAMRAPAAWQRAELQRRARLQASIGAVRKRATVEHTGQGTGSGRFGYCPGILDGTTVVARDTADGVVMTVTARNPDLVDELRTSARSRLQRLERERATAKR